MLEYVIDKDQLTYRVIISYPHIDIIYLYSTIVLIYIFHRNELVILKYAQSNISSIDSCVFNHPEHEFKYLNLPVIVSMNLILHLNFEHELNEMYVGNSGFAASECTASISCIST
jgi:hypothetical protein